MLENSSENIAEIIRRKRQERGLTQAELSLRSDVPLRTLQGLESGKAEPRFETIRAIAKTLGIESDELWGESKPSNRLSAGATSGELSAADGAVILSEMAKLSLPQRNFLLAILFRDASLADGTGESALSAALQVIQKAE